MYIYKQKDMVYLIEEWQSKDYYIHKKKKRTWCTSLKGGNPMSTRLVPCPARFFLVRKKRVSEYAHTATLEKRKKASTFAYI